MQVVVTNMETTYISKCCKTPTKEDENDEQIRICTKCQKNCEVEEVCAHCLGTGEVWAMGSVYPGEPHQALVDMRDCPFCKHSPDPLDYIR